MTSPGNFKTYKQRGEWVELLFMTRAAEFGLNVSKPWGDPARYDYFVCSSDKVRSILLGQLSSLKVPSRRVHYETFGLGLKTD